MAQVGGADPEEFDAIAKRYVAQRPEARRTPGNQLRAMKNFMRMLIASPIDPIKTERSRDHALLENGTFAPDSTEWMATHNVDNAFGWEPDTKLEPEHLIARVAG